MKIIFLIFSFSIIYRVSAFAYPDSFPNISCEKQFKERNISSNYYDESKSYDSYYKSLDRKKCFKEWTVLIFMAADNDLSPYAYWDIYEMERRLSGQKNLGATTERIDVIAEVDTINRNGINRYHIFQTEKIYDQDVDLDFFSTFTDKNIDSPIIKSYLEQNNTVKDQNVRLERFLFQSMRDYPSKHYMLVIWGHGEGYIGSNYSSKLENYQTLAKSTLVTGRYFTPENVSIKSLSEHYKGEVSQFPYDKVFGGVAFDYTDASFLDIPSLQKTIKKTLMQLQYDKPLDLITFDACLMQTLEVATELINVTDFVLGSTQIQDYLGLPYKMILDTLNEHISPLDLAHKIPGLVQESMKPDGYQGMMSIKNKGNFTASTISTQILKNFFIPTFMDFSSSLIEYLEEDMFRMLDFKVILENSPAFMGETRDIGIFLATIEQLLYAEKNNQNETLKGIHLKNKILNLWDTLNQMVIHNSFGPYYTDPSLNQNENYFLNYFKGLSLWIPSNKLLYDHRITEFKNSALFKNFNQLKSISPYEQVLKLIYEHME